jgi:hypothetical protein
MGLLLSPFSSLGAPLSITGTEYVIDGGTVPTA